jgi:ABC-type multidrug transport system ATPase subunit/ABC-type multidrug transport system permease subunit
MQEEEEMIQVAFDGKHSADNAGIDMPGRKGGFLLSFENITKDIVVNKEKKTILHPLSGSIAPGQCCCLMGPSGSGKTTLLDTLAGRYLTGVSGSVFVDGVPWVKSMKRMTAYVLQEDVFFTHLTVREQLEYTAMLRLEGTPASKRAETHKVMEQLNILKCADTKIEAISGGEKKRVNIGTELLTDPRLVFLDEPTSGLDSTAALALANTLRKLATELGKTVLTSIHQPSSAVFHSFDKLVLLVDGHCVYFGAPGKVVDYFAQHGFICANNNNPADFVLDTVSQPNAKGVMVQAYRPSPDPFPHRELTRKNTAFADAEKAPRWPTGWCQQFRVLYRRSFKHGAANFFTLVNFIQSVALALVVGAVYYQMPNNETHFSDRVSFLFFIMVFWPLTILFGSMMAFPFERPIINKERNSGSYRLSAYFVAKSVAELPLVLGLPLIFYVIAYFMAGLRAGGFLGFLVGQVLSLLAAESVGLFLGIAFSDLKTAVVIATVTQMFQMLVGGFFVQVLPSWLAWASFLSPFTHSLNVCMFFEFSDDVRVACDQNGAVIPMCAGRDFVTGAEIREWQETGDLEMPFLIIAAYFLIFRTAAYLALRFLKHNTTGRA